MKASAQNVFQRLSNLGSLKSMLADLPADQIPADKRDILENIKLSDDCIELPGGPVGSIRLRVVEQKAPVCIRLKGGYPGASRPSAQCHTSR